jgi:threonine dehydratase
VTELVSLDIIRDAARRIRDVAVVTPLLEVRDDPAERARRTGLLLKCENLQASGAFKIRGAYNMVAQLSPEERERGVITYSSGNHGLALALAARLLGAPAVIVMPTKASPVKVDGARRFGAEVLFEGTTTLERKARAEVEAKARGLTIVPPFDHEWIIAGQGTMGLEILAQCPTLAAVYVQMSGGGLISGVSAAIKQSKPSVRIIGVEAAGAARMTASLKAGRPVTLEKVSGVADGLLAVRPGDLTFAHVKAFVDEVVTVDDAGILDALRWLFERAKLVVEPSGAITVAAALKRAPEGDGPDHPTVAVLSGGNVAAGDYARYLTGSE